MQQVSCATKGEGWDEEKIEDMFTLTMVLKTKDYSACMTEVHGSRDGDNEEGQEEQEERGEEDDHAEPKAYRKI